jgi:hypothetical protein
VSPLRHPRHESQASDLRGTGGHSASILGRAVIGIYAQSMRDPARAARALDLIDAIVLARSYRLAEQLAKIYC